LLLKITFLTFLQF